MLARSPKILEISIGKAEAKSRREPIFFKASSRSPCYQSWIRSLEKTAFYLRTNPLCVSQLWRHKANIPVAMEMGQTAVAPRNQMNPWDAGKGYLCKWYPADWERKASCTSQGCDYPVQKKKNFIMEALWSYSGNTLEDEKLRPHIILITERVGEETVKEPGELLTSTSWCHSRLGSLGTGMVLLPRWLNKNLFRRRFGNQTSRSNTQNHGPKETASHVKLDKLQEPAELQPLPQQALSFTSASGTWLCYLWEAPSWQPPPALSKAELPLCCHPHQQTWRLTQACLFLAPIWSKVRMDASDWWSQVAEPASQSGHVEVASDFLTGRTEEFLNTTKTVQKALGSTRWEKSSMDGWWLMVTQ